MIDNKEILADTGTDNWYREIGNRVYQITDTMPIFRLNFHSKWYRLFLDELLEKAPGYTDENPVFTEESVALRQSLECSYCERLFNRYGNCVAILEDGTPISLMFGAASDNPEGIHPRIVKADALSRTTVEWAARNGQGIGNFFIPTEVLDNVFPGHQNSEYRIIGSVDPVGGFQHVRLLWSYNQVHRFVTDAYDNGFAAKLAKHPGLIDFSAVKSITNTFNQVFQNPNWREQLEKLDIKFTAMYADNNPALANNLRMFSAFLKDIDEAVRSNKNSCTEMVVWNRCSSPAFYAAVRGIRSTCFGAAVIDRYLMRKDADLEKCLAELMKWKSPENYMRGNTKLVTAIEMRQASKALKEPGYLDSLYRRICTTKEVREALANVLIWSSTLTEASEPVVKNAFEKIADDMDAPELEAPFEHQARPKHVSLATFLSVLQEKQPDRLFILTDAQENWGFWHTTDAKEPKAISRLQRSDTDPVCAVFIRPIGTTTTFTTGVVVPNLAKELETKSRVYSYLERGAKDRHYVELDGLYFTPWDDRIAESGMDLSPGIIYTVKSNLRGIVPESVMEEFVKEQSSAINQPIAPDSLPKDIQKHRQAIANFGQQNKMEVVPGFNWLLNSSKAGGEVRVFTFKHKGVTLSYAVHFVD